MRELFTVKRAYSGKGWVVYSAHTGTIVNRYVTHRRAYYEASLLNGMVTEVFKYEF